MADEEARAARLRAAAARSKKDAARLARRSAAALASIPTTGTSRGAHELMVWNEFQLPAVAAMRHAQSLTAAIPIKERVADALQNKLPSDVARHVGTFLPHDPLTGSGRRNSGGRVEGGLRLGSGFLDNTLDSKAYALPWRPSITTTLTSRNGWLSADSAPTHDPRSPATSTVQLAIKDKDDARPGSKQYVYLAANYNEIPAPIGARLNPEILHAVWLRVAEEGVPLDAKVVLVAMGDGPRTRPGAVHANAGMGSLVQYYRRLGFTPMRGQEANAAAAARSTNPEDPVDGVWMEASLGSLIDHGGPAEAHFPPLDDVPGRAYLRWNFEKEKPAPEILDDEEEYGDEYGDVPASHHAGTVDPLAIQEMKDAFDAEQAAYNDDDAPWMRTHEAASTAAAAAAAPPPPAPAWTSTLDRDRARAAALMGEATENAARTAEGMRPRAPAVVGTKRPREEGSGLMLSRAIIRRQDDAADAARAAAAARELQEAIDEHARRQEEARRAHEAEDARLAAQLERVEDARDRRRAVHGFTGGGRLAGGGVIVTERPGINHAYGYGPTNLEAALRKWDAIPGYDLPANYPANAIKDIVGAGLTQADLLSILRGSTASLRNVDYGVETPKRANATLLSIAPEDVDGTLFGYVEGALKGQPPPPPAALRAALDASDIEFSAPQPNAVEDWESIREKIFALIDEDYEDKKEAIAEFRKSQETSVFNKLINTTLAVGQAVSDFATPASALKSAAETVASVLTRPQDTLPSGYSFEDSLTKLDALGPVGGVVKAVAMVFDLIHHRPSDGETLDPVVDRVLSGQKQQLYQCMRDISEGVMFQLNAAPGVRNPRQDQINAAAEWAAKLNAAKARSRNSASTSSAPVIPTDAPAMSTTPSKATKAPTKATTTGIESGSGRPAPAAGSAKIDFVTSKGEKKSVTLPTKSSNRNALVSHLCKTEGLSVPDASSLVSAHGLYVKAAK